MPPAYEILLLNTAIPQIQAAQSGDTYVVPRDIAFSAALTLSAGTANGVPYLSSPGKVLTTGSALTFDGASAYLGIGTASPAQRLHIVSSGNAFARIDSGAASTAGILFNNGNGALYYDATSNYLRVDVNGSERMRLTTTGLKASIAGTNADPVFSYTSDTNTGIFFPAADKLGFTAGGGSDQMVLTTTGLGIGKSSPDTNLHVKGATNGWVTIQRGDDANNIAWLSWMNNTSNANQWGLGLLNGSNNLQVFNYATTSSAAVFDSSGNLGLGVTPSAWYTGYTASQIGVNGSVWANRTTADTNIVGIGSNQFLNSGATNRLYISDGFATRYEQANGAHSWFTAPSGTADGTAATSLTSAQNGNSYTIKVAGTTDFTLIGAANNNVGTTFTKSGGTGAGTGTVSQNISFTQAMTLTEVSNLKLGGTADRATTVGTNHLDIFNGTAPVGTLTNGISIYSSSGEAYVMDAAGNATLFSPHDRETNEWIFRSKHTPTGKVLKIDVERLLKFVNDHFGLDAVHEFVEK